MPKGGPRVGAGRPKGSKDKVRRLIGLPKPEKLAQELRRQDQTPLDYMLSIVHDENADPGRRDRLAVAAAPYCHPKAGEAGKKGERQTAATEAASGAFGIRATPLKLIKH